MVKPLKSDNMEIETGRSMQDWIKFLDAAGGRTLSHGEIVAKVKCTGTVSGWWAQFVAIAYEQQTGRRLPGQKSDGTFSASLSRSLAMGAAEARERWIAVMDALPEIAGSATMAAPAASDTRSGLNWRCKLADGSKITASFLEAKPGKTLGTVEHAGLGSSQDIERFKAYWAAIFAKLTQPADTSWQQM